MDPKGRFEGIRSKVGEEFIGVWDVYAKEGKLLAHDPIHFMKYEEVLKRREELERTGAVVLTGVAAVSKTFLNKDLDFRGRKGSFREVKWFDAYFEPIVRPSVIEAAEKFLNKDSGWLKGGPSYSNEKRGL